MSQAAIKLWSPDPPEILLPDPAQSTRDQGTAHRITHPVRTPPPIELTTQSEYFASFKASHQSGPRQVPATALTRVRETQTLPEFYREWMAPFRATQKDEGQVTSGTLSKERQALNRWSAYEQTTQPDDWPGSEPWRGCPIGYLEGKYIDQFFRWMRESTEPHYAADTIKSTRNHLRGVLNHAQRIGAIEAVPAISPLDRSDVNDLEEDLSTIWTWEEMERLYQAMEGHFDLQTAFVLDCNAGPRAVDLFQLRWDQNVRLNEAIPIVKFKAVKTKKNHGIPLHPIVIEHLRRLREPGVESGSLVFPRLVSGEAADPEKSRAARRRNQLIKNRMKQAGVPDHMKPWQVCRATCCTHLNDVSKGIGDWVIGQGLPAETKLSSDYYYNPSERAMSAILSLKQPAAFTSVLSH